MPRIRLTPHKRGFYDLFCRASANAIVIAQLLVEVLDRPSGEREALVSRIKEREHEGDRITHDLIGLLNRTFVTPLDRDDIYRLAGALDDICDHIDEAADDVALYGIDEVPEKAKAQADVVLRAVTKLDEAVRLLEGLGDAREQLAALRELEDEGDRLVREAVAELFRSGVDALTVIRFKDVHDRLEDAVDACEEAADVLEAILVKNR